MPFNYPSHKNSNNERRARRANLEADVVKTPAPTVEQEMERMRTTAAALITDNRVSAVDYGHCTGYRIQLSPMNWREVIANGKPRCHCGDSRKFGTCADLLAVEMFIAAGNEADKQAKIRAARELLAALAAEEYEIPSRGFVNVTEKKVVAAVERAAGQEFSCEVRKTGMGKYRIFSFASGNVYSVELNRGIFGVTAHCSCPDFECHRLRRDEVCKHISAVYHFERQVKVIRLNEFNAPSFAAA